MRLNRLSITNYRQYRGPMEIDFTSSDAQRQFIVIEGANGAGKSNIMNAITWCLYEEELHLKGKDRILPVPNTGVLGGTIKGSFVDVCVEMHLEDEDGVKFILTRTRKYRKLEGGSAQAMESGLEFNLRYLEGNDWKIAQDPAFFIKSHIPPAIKEYFFFDGERLDRYFQDAGGASIKDAVYDIAQINLLEVTLRHIAAHRTAIAKSEGDVGSRVPELSDQIDLLRQDNDKHKAETAALRSQRTEFEGEERTLNEELRESPIKLVQELQRQRLSLNNDLKTLDAQLKDGEQQRTSNVIRYAPLIVAHGALNTALARIKETSDSGRIPPQFTRVFIDHLLSKERCICGSQLPQGSQERKRVEEVRREADDVSEIVGEITSAHGEILRLKERAASFRELQLHQNREIGRLQTSYDTKSRALKAIEEQLGGINEEQVQAAERRLQEVRKRREALASQIAIREDKEKRTDEKIDQLEGDLRKAIAKEAKYQDLRSKLEFLESAEKLCLRVRDNIVTGVRRQVEASTRQHFFELIWKDTTFKTIEIREDYRVSVIHESGLEAMDSLSAGERQVLALSFLAALNEVSGFQVPIVIDTPLGRISDEPTASIAQNLPNYLEGRQVFLLMTDKEYKGPVRTELARSVQREFKIRVGSDSSGTTSEVIPYGEN